MVNEKRLIDANARIKWMEDNTANSEWMVNQYNADWICSMLETAPTVDAVEVVHGHWVSLTECANAGVYCSVCNKKVYKEDYAWCNRKNKLRSNYCPNCGAKMDGDGNG